MNYKIVVDSCCDITPQMEEEYGIVSVPLTITLGDKTFSDDASLDLADFLLEMKRCTGRIGTAAPAPSLYREAYGTAQPNAVTLSSNLSGSYASAMLENPLPRRRGAEVHVFDSLSASAGEVLIALKLGRLLREGLQRSRIIAAVERYISEMKTYFILESTDNLRKNGRLGRVTGKLISVLNVRPIFTADGAGHIALYSHARGERQILDRLADTVGKSGKRPKASRW